MTDHRSLGDIPALLVRQTLDALAGGTALADCYDLLETAGLARALAIVDKLEAEYSEDTVKAVREYISTELATRDDISSGQDTPALRLELRRRTSQEWAAHAEDFLRWLAKNETGSSFDFADSTGAEAWEYVALACLARKQREGALKIEYDISSQANRFANAIGFREAVEGTYKAPALKERTASIARVASRGEVESAARTLANLIDPSDLSSDTRQTLEYVLIELLRNVVQHSHDKLGGLVAAQVVYKEYRDDNRQGVQLAVADNGLGIQRSLSYFHRDIKVDARAAINKALQPHISGAFEEGKYGGDENAGLGLFFVSEMCKTLGGRLLLSSRGATYYLDGDESGTHEHRVSFLRNSASYPGTLIVAEIPQISNATSLSYVELIESIHCLAEERTPRSPSPNWLHYTPPPPDTYTVHVLVAAPSMSSTRTFVENTLIKRLEAGVAVCLDFTGMTVLTQSRAHELIYHPIRVAYEHQVAMHIQGACPAVAKALYFVQRYALQGY